MIKIDLHTHSNCSDGTFTPEDLIALAKERQINILSITDHDNIDSLSRVVELAKEAEIELIPGVEVSCLYNNLDIHILAYYFDPEHPALTKMLEFVQNARALRAKQMLDKLSELGLHLDFEELRSRVGNPNAIGRPHMAQMLVEKKLCSSINYAFEKYIGDDSPAYLPKPSLHPQEVIDAIHESGGVAVLAHPAKINNEFYNLEIIEMGIDGLETYYILHDKVQIDFYKSVADRYNLINTGGSDFHGFRHQIYDWGKFSAPEYCVDELKERSKRYGTKEN